MKEEIRDAVYTIIAMLAKRTLRPMDERALNDNVGVLLKEVDDRADEFARGVLASLRGARGLDRKIAAELMERFGEVERPNSPFENTTNPKPK
jgi:hypothetical protein